MSTLPTLFKKTSTGAIQQWSVAVDDAIITTTYGQVDGAMQSTQDTITEGKNLGKKNATTPQQRALLEAAARHERQLKKGYVADIDAAKRGDVDDVIEGGVVPMLAKVYSDRQDKINFPVAVQPKLDGHRCVAVVELKAPDGADFGSVCVTLWTRTRKRIKSMPHIESELATIVLNYIKTAYFTNSAEITPPVPDQIILDGELYAHSHRDDFEKLSSLIRPDEPRPGHEQVEYHVYDVVSPETFLNRFAKLEHLFDDTKHIRLVETHIANDEAQLLGHYDFFKKQGYEGAMVRSLDTGYEHKRSSSLLKMKDFLDAEFRIVRLEEGRGRLQGHVGAFVCVTTDGKEFAAKMAGATEALRTAWESPEQWIGKLLTIKYQSLTADGIPRFPVGLRIRGDEE